MEVKDVYSAQHQYSYPHLALQSAGGSTCHHQQCHVELLLPKCTFEHRFRGASKYVTVMLFPQIRKLSEHCSSDLERKCFHEGFDGFHSFFMISMDVLKSRVDAMTVESKKTGSSLLANAMIVFQ